jgi:hypothetical protein
MKMRLTESSLRNMIQEAVMEVIKEGAMNEWLWFHGMEDKFDEKKEDDKKTSNKKTEKKPKNGSPKKKVNERRRR